jgi:thiamine kinase-like enzyme
MTNPQCYKYVMIKGRYFCLNQDPIRLFFYLYLFTKALRLHPGIIRVSPFSVVRRLIQIRLRISGRRKIIELPFYGNLCLPVHHGFKIFNFRKKTVVKSILPKVNQSVLINEIETVKKTSLLHFAPKLRDWNVDGRWYEEDFINGSPFYPNPRSETNISIKIFDHKILPCLKEMILLQRAKKIALHDYVEDIKESITQRLRSMPLIQKAKQNAINRFLETNHSALLKKNNTSVPLVFSHGDFSLVNILNTKIGIKVIDWEGAGIRNPLYDLFNYFLTELYYKRIPGRIFSEVIKAIDSLKSAVIDDLPEIANSLEPFSEIYRKLYYLERLGMLLMRDESENNLKVILNSMELFDSFEMYKR